MNLAGLLAGRGPVNLFVRIAHRQGHAARAALVLAGFVFASIAFAADDDKIIYPGGSANAASPAPIAGSSVNSITLALAVALAAVGGWMVWRNRRRTPGGRDTRSLALDETRSLGNRQYLVVASYEGKKFLLGVCPGRIEMLTPLGEPKQERAVE